MNGPYTHGALIDLGGGATAFVDGIPDTCEHDYSGPTVIYTHGGKRIDYRTFPHWAGYTDRLRVDLIMFHLRADGDSPHIVTGCCTKCRKEYQPEMF